MFVHGRYFQSSLIHVKFTGKSEASLFNLWAGLDKALQQSVTKFITMISLGLVTLVAPAGRDFI